MPRKPKGPPAARSRGHVRAPAHRQARLPPEVRRVVYTTNALESVHAQLRKIIKTRGHFPTDDAATKLLWLALRTLRATWQRTAYAWSHAMNPCAILYGDRFTPATS